MDQTTHTEHPGNCIYLLNTFVFFFTFGRYFFSLDRLGLFHNDLFSVNDPSELC